MTANNFWRWMFRNEDRKPVAEWRKDVVISAFLLLYARKVGQEESASSASVDQGVTAGLFWLSRNWSRW